MTDVIATEKTREELIKENLEKMENFIGALTDANLNNFDAFGEGFTAGFVAGINLNKQKGVA